MIQGNSSGQKDLYNKYNNVNHEKKTYQVIHEN